MSTPENDVRSVFSMKHEVCINTETENAIQSSLVPTQGFLLRHHVFQQTAMFPELKAG